MVKAEDAVPLFEPFTRFPVELRQKLYGDALAEEVQPVLIDTQIKSHPIHASLNTYHYTTRPTRPCDHDYNSAVLYPILIVRLLQVSHSVPDEARSMYYKLNAFRFFRPKELYEWLSGLGAEQRNQIVSIKCKLEMCECSLGAVELLANCEHLQELKIPLDCGDLMEVFIPSFSTRQLGMWQADTSDVVPIKLFTDPLDGRPYYPAARQWPGIATPEDSDKSRRVASPDGLKEFMIVIGPLSKQLDSTCTKGCGPHVGRERVDMEIEIEIEMWNKMMFAASVSSFNDIDT